MATVMLPPNLPELRMAFTGDGAIGNPLTFPQPFAEGPGDSLVMPMNEGMLFPADDPAVATATLLSYCGHGGSRCRGAGLYDATGAGVVTLIRTPDDAEVDMNRDSHGELYTQVRWDPSRGQFAYPRKLTYIFFD